MGDDANWLLAGQLFGDRAVAEGRVSREQADECLEILRRLAESGATPLPPLSELLVRRGYLPSSDVDATVTPDSRPTAPADLPPEVVDSARIPGNRFGRYVRVARLGEGGMGEVWWAWDTGLHRWVALKLLKADRAELTDRFTREAQLAAKLSHPNIAAVYEVGQAEGRHFIAMQYVRGKTLSRLRDLPRREIVALVRDAARALHYAHEQGVVHRDIKPANLMVEEPQARLPSEALPAPGVDDGRRRRVFVMDFGLAKQTEVDSQSISGMVLGTPAYMPPEQAQGRVRAIDARSDVYALGATLYDLLSGSPPFRSSNVYELLAFVCDRDPAPLKGVDADLQTIVLKCLDKDPARRYRTAAELADELARWLAGEPITAHAPSIFYRARKFLARRRALVLSISAAVLATSAFLGYAAADYRARAEKEALGALCKRLDELPRTPEGSRRGLDLIASGLPRFRNTWDLWIRQGEFLERLGRHAESVDAYARAIEANPKLGWAHYRRGRVLMDRLDRRDEALAEFDRAIAVEPDNEYAHVGRARGAALRGDDAGALRLLDEAAKIASHVDDLHFLRGYVHARRDGPLQDFQEAIGDFTRAIELNPAHALAFMNRGAAKLKTGDSTGALGDMNESARLEPRYWAIYSNRAAVQAELGNMDEVIADCTRCLELNPRDVQSYALRGAALLKREDLAGARDDLSRAVELDRDHAGSWYNLGRVYARRRQLKDAEDAYTRALELRPHDADAYEGRAHVRAERGDLAGAVCDWTETLRVDPKRVGAVVNRGRDRRLLGDLDGAWADAQRAVELAPQDAKSHMLAGAILGLRGDFDRALAAFGRAAALKPDEPDTYHNRGNIFMHLKQWRDAVAEYDRAIALDARATGNFMKRGECRLRLQQYEEAQADFDKAIALEPGNPLAWFYRGSAAMFDGLIDRAIADFQRALEVAPRDWNRRDDCTKALEMARELRKGK